MKPRLAVFLAAGLGTRLGPMGTMTPKGLIRVGGTTLIERSIASLRASGIERFIIVTGHLSEQYEDLARRLGDSVTTRHNVSYAARGSSASFCCVGPIDEPYLLAESDLLYEPRAPRLLVDAPEGDVLLASGPTASGDEVFVGVEGCRLMSLTKRRDRLVGTCAGELVGLTRISPALHAAMLREAASLLRHDPLTDYESVLVAAGRDHTVKVLVVQDLVWTEVDDARQLERAFSLTCRSGRAITRHSPPNPRSSSVNSSG